MKITSNTNWIGLKADTEFTLLRRYFYNGESWVRVRDAAGVVHEYPDVFFNEPVEVEDV